MIKHSHKTWVEIDSRALKNNLNFFRKIVGPKVRICAVIKSNAYGHGLQDVAEILSEEKNLMLGVDSLDEAFLLKNNETKHPVMILGFIPRFSIREAVKNGFHFSLYKPQDLKFFPKGSKVHLKIESGTNRLGISLEDLNKIKKFPQITGIYTHFADVENLKSGFYKTQLKILNKASAILNSKGIFPEFIHSASSSAILRDPETHFNLVRLGLGLYTKPNLVLSWKTRVAQTKIVGKGETIGYDRTYKAKKKMKIAILPIGYWDGFDRGLSNKGKVLIRGKFANIVGRVCMNMTIVDIFNIPDAKTGEEVVLLGRSGSREISADMIAKNIGTINYEVLTRINPLIPRIVV